MTWNIRKFCRLDLCRVMRIRHTVNDEPAEPWHYSECGWLNITPEVTWYGWDVDQLTTRQTDLTRIHTLYQPGSFTPLLRVEIAVAELAKAVR